MTTNSIFVLKPIWDLLYEDAKKDKEEMEQLRMRLRECNEEYVIEYKREIEQLKKQVQTLEQYNRKLYLENTTLKSCANHNVFMIDDAAYAEEANAPATVYHEVKHVEIQEAIPEEPAPMVAPMVAPSVVPDAHDALDTQVEESTKTVKMIGTKTKQEYQREYQRAYRKKKKSITVNM
jgi:regulator of replication initiation timing